MKDILRLIRWPNLLIIALSMSFVLFFVISPILGSAPLVDGMDPLLFFLLVFSTIMISIGGYVINDIFDINPDSINKPGKNIVSSSITINTAYTIYWITTITGVLSGTLLAYLINQINFGLIFLFSAGLLWFYSQKYQCQPLIGNIVISALSAISFGIVWLFEFYALSNNAGIFVNVQSQFPLVTRIVSIYMGFAFIVSLLRETIKDIEDYKGDNRFGCLTFTVKFGVSTSKILALIITYLSLLLSIAVQVYYYNADFILPYYAFYIIDLLIISIIYMIHMASQKQNYSKIATFIKLLMLAGILSMVLFNFEF